MASPYFASGKKGGSPYFSGGGSGGSAYFSTAGSSAASGQHHGGLLGVLENLGSDAESAVTGLYPGLKTLGESIGEDVADPKVWEALGHAAVSNDPKQLRKASRLYRNVIQPAGKSYAQTYGPLGHGDVHGFLHQLDQHPLGPILDLLTVASLGAGGAAKVATAAERAGAESRLVSAVAKLNKPGEIKLTGPAAEGHEAKVLVKPTSSRPLRKAAQKAIDAALKAPGPQRERVALARFGRELRRNPDTAAQQIRLELTDYMRAFAPLSKKERVAVHVLGRLPLPKHLDSWKQMLEKVASSGTADAESARATLRLLDDPKVQELYLHPSEAMLKAHAAADRIGQRSAELLGFSPEDQTLSRMRHVRLVSGAVAYTAKDARRRIRELDRQLRGTARTAATVEKQATRLRARGTPELRAVRGEATKTANQAARAAASRQRLQAALSSADQAEAMLAHARGDVERLATGKQLSSDELLAGGLKPRSDLSAARTRLLGQRYDQYTRLASQYDRALQRVADLANRIPDTAGLEGRQADQAARLEQARADVASRLAAGRAELERLAAVEDQLTGERGIVQPGIVGGPDIADLQAEIEAAGRPQPIYQPDTAQLDRKGIFGRGRSAANVPKRPVHRSVGLLFRIGQLALEPDVLSPEFLRSVVYSHFVDLHDALVDAAVPLFRGDALPDGWVYVKRLPGETIGYVEKTRGAHRHSLEQLVPDVAKPQEGRLAEQGLATADEKDAVLDHGRRYAVPERLAKQFESEMRASNNAGLAFFRKFTTVWRALVLGLRVGFLTNNIVGNHVLYALRYAGPAGLRAYLEAVKRVEGEGAVRKLLTDHRIPDSQRRLFMEELFPEQVSGTLIGTQLPNTTAGRAVRKLSAGLVPADRASEQTLRRAATEAALRKSPEFKQAARALSGSRFVKLMPSQTKEFEQAARKALADHPDLQRRVSDQVNDALGSYLSLSEFEKRTVRAFFPFYAWYRAIVQIAVKLPVDAPGRTSILARLGQIGDEDTTNELGPLPSYLRGAIPLGGDTLLSTQGLNPLTTLTQLGQAGKALGPGASPQQRSSFGGMLNPLLGALLQEYSKGTDKASPFGVPGDILSQIGTNLPQYKAVAAATGHAPPSKLYTNSALQRELSSFLGLPYRKINRGEAAKRHARGD